MIPPSFLGAHLPRTDSGLNAAAAIVGCDPIALRAVIAVETGGAGYLPDGRPKILCERHRFHALTGGRFDASDPAVSNPAPGGYLGGAAEYKRLAEMFALDRDAALRATSWGLPQIMGSNFALAGFEAVDDMVAAFCNSEDEQLAAMAAFIVAAHLAAPLIAQDWAAFAHGYNGPNYAANRYDEKLADAYARLQAP